MLDPATFRYREELVLQAKANFALFGRSGNRVSAVTYNFPTPSAARGLCKAICHANSYFPVLNKLEILRPIRTVCIPETQFKAACIPTEEDYPRHSGKVLKSPNTAVYLQDVEYRFHFTIWAPEKRKVKKLRNHIASGAAHCSPYMGTRDCIAEIVPVDDTPRDKTVNLIEPSMLIGSYPTMIEAKEGLVVFPDWTKERLLELRLQRAGLESEELEDTEADDDSL